MTDLIVFVIIVGLVLGVGIVVGMIAAGRIDRILSPGTQAVNTAAADPAAVPEVVEEQQR